jgi:hypothetical protein
MADESRQDGMKINAARAQQLVENISNVTARVNAVAGEYPVRVTVW